MVWPDGATSSRQFKMTIFDLDKSISVEFHGVVDVIEKKMLGLWADKRLKNLQSNIEMKLINERVSISFNKVVVAEIPFMVFEQLATVEIVEILLTKIKERFE